MTINWTFFNIPQGSERFEARLSPTVGDYIFKFNLAVHTPGDKMQLTASQSYISGNLTGDLRVRGNSNQEVLLLIEDENGMKRQMKFSPAERWVRGRDVGMTAEGVDYRNGFVESLGMSEQHMYCKALFEEYKVLRAKTHVQIENPPKRGESYAPQMINANDLIRTRILAKELAKNCEDYLRDQPDDWFDIEKYAED